MNSTYYASEIKARITMPELLSFHGFHLNSKNRMPCPFHSGKDDNFGVKEHFYHCFVCGEKGDIFTFVQKYFELSFSESIAKLNEDFALGLPIGEKLDMRKRMELGRKSFERRKEQAARDKKREQVQDAYFDAYDKWLELDNVVRYQKPKNPGEATPEYIVALSQIENAKYNLECAERRLYEYEQSC